ncbi:MAG: GNAT family N-acetyltransferase [Bacteroidota bacterium]|nr:GNAT family N-acetyltransferase [Bacteroidota bacterium]
MSVKPMIETERLWIRQWITADLAPFCRLNGDPVAMEFFPATLTEEQSRDQMNRIRQHINQKGYGFFALERKDTGEFIGFTGLWHPSFTASFTPCTEIGWRILPQHWNQGFATEAAKACLQFGFTRLDLSEIVSFTSVHNHRSEKVMQKIGMQKTLEFNHPKIAPGHYLEKHVLYQISKEKWNENTIDIRNK